MWWTQKRIATRSQVPLWIGRQCKWVYKEARLLSSWLIWARVLQKAMIRTRFRKIFLSSACRVWRVKECGSTILFCGLHRLNTMVRLNKTDSIRYVFVVSDWFLIVWVVGIWPAPCAGLSIHFIFVNIVHTWTFSLFLGKKKVIHVNFFTIDDG